MKRHSYLGTAIEIHPLQGEAHSLRAAMGGHPQNHYIHHKPQLDAGAEHERAFRKASRSNLGSTANSNVEFLAGQEEQPPISANNSSLQPPISSMSSGVSSRKMIESMR